jgi:adenine phosphoribosyltransferase
VNSPDTPALPVISSAAEEVLRLLVSVPDFPTPGIMFRDLTPVFADAHGYRAVTDALRSAFDGPIDVVAGVEARGFLLAASVAYAAGAGVVAVRKAGKLPGEVLTESYDLEYGSAALDIHPASIPGQRMVILDDVLATGGTLAATVRLAERAGYTVVGVGVVLELADLSGRAGLDGTPVHAIVSL